MFACYLDDSSAEGASVVVLAGYLASINAWEQYEIQARQIYDSYGVDVLDTKRLHATRGPYKGWSRIKKRSFVNELFEIAAPNISLGISVAFQKSTFKAFKRSHKRISSMSAYGAVFGVLITTLFSERIPKKLTESIKSGGLSFRVESGNRNNEDIYGCFLSMKDSPMYGGYLKSLKFVGKGDCKAIHLADYHAFHSRRFQNYFARLGGKMDVPISHEYMSAISRIPHRFELVGGRPTIRPKTSEIIFPEVRGSWIGPLPP